MYKKLLVFVALIAIAFSFNVNLERTVVENGTPAKEIVYTFKSHYGGDQSVNTVFDIADDENWLLEASQCKDCVNGQPAHYVCSEDNKDCEITQNRGGNAYGFAGEVQFTDEKGNAAQAYLKGQDDVTIAGHKFENLSINFPQKSKTQSGAPAMNLLEAAQASYGLGPSRNSASFVDAFNKKRNGNVQIESPEFSLFVGETSQFVFGEPNGFFRTSEFEVFENHHTTKQQQQAQAFSLKVDSIKVLESTIDINNVNQDSLNNNNNNSFNDLYGVFQSTSNYISFQNRGTLANIVKQINNSNSANCVENNQYYYVCENVNSFPNLYFQMSDKYNNKEFVLTEADYVQRIEVNGEKKVQLLLRTGLYGSQNFGIGNVGANLVYLGYPFFNRHYVNFNYAKDTVGIADKYHFTPTNKDLEQNWFGWLLGIGILVTIGSVAAILAILTEVPYDGKSQAGAATSAFQYQQLNETQQGQSAVVGGQPQRFHSISNLSPSKIIYSYPKSPTRVHHHHNQSPQVVQTSSYVQQQPTRVSYVPQQQNVRTSQQVVRQSQQIVRQSNA